MLSSAIEPFFTFRLSGSYFFKNKAEEDNFEGCGTRRPERILKEREYALKCLELCEMLLEERSGIEN